MTADTERQSERVLRLEELLDTAEAIALTMARKLEAIREISYGWVDSEAIDAILDGDFNE